MTLNEFHEANGWHFLRLDDGSVRIRSEHGGASFVHIIPGNSWASVVAAVAPGHGTAEEYAAAERLHAAKPPQHVCGLNGFGLSPDDVCPACQYGVPRPAPNGEQTE
jgi:hypothetical protein